MGELQESKFKKKTFEKKMEWEEITAGDFKQLFGDGSRFSEMGKTLNDWKDKFTKNHFSEQLVPNKKLEERIDRSYKANFRNKTISSLTKGKRAKKTVKKVLLQKHLLDEQQRFLDKKKQERADVLKYFDRSKIKDPEALRRLYRTNEDLEAVSEWGTRENEKGELTINYALFSGSPLVRMQEYQRILLEVDNKIRPERFQYDSDRDFASGYARKYRMLCKACAAMPFLRKYLSYHKDHNLRAFPAARIYAKLLCLQELKAHYEDKMELLTSPFYALIARKDLKGLSGPDKEKALKQEIKSTWFRNYIRLYHKVSSSKIGKGADLKAFFRMREREYENTHLRLEDEPAARESFNAPEVPQQEVKEKDEEVPVREMNAEQKSSPLQEEKKYVNSTPTGDDEELQEKLKHMENPFRKKERSADDEKKYVNSTPTGDEEQQAKPKYMENPFRKKDRSAEEKKDDFFPPEHENENAAMFMQEPVVVDQSRMRSDDDYFFAHLGETFMDGASETQLSVEKSSDLEESGSVMEETLQLDELDEFGIAIHDEQDMLESDEMELNAKKEFAALKNNDFADEDEEELMDGDLISKEALKQSSFADQEEEKEKVEEEHAEEKSVSREEEAAEEEFWSAEDEGFMNDTIALVRKKLENGDMLSPGDREFLTGYYSPHFPADFKQLAEEYLEKNRKKKKKAAKEEKGQEKEEQKPVENSAADEKASQQEDMDERLLRKLENREEFTPEENEYYFRNMPALMRKFTKRINDDIAEKTGIKIK